MRVGRDIKADGFEILNDRGDMVGAAYRDAKTGRVDVNATGFHGEWDSLPRRTQELQDFAEAEFHRRDATKAKA